MEDSTPIRNPEDPQSAPRSSLKILISAGPTREYFDTVRFISNASTGKQGYALARSAAARGHQVVLVSGPVELQPPPGVQLIRVTSAREMAEVCKDHFQDSDIAIMTAAVCDYRPVTRLHRKLKKNHDQRHVNLEPTEDICASLGKVKQQRILVGFAMDDHDPRVNAEAKLQRKNCDFMVQNGPRNIGSDSATIHLLTSRDGWEQPFKGTKDQVAQHLISILEAHVITNSRKRET